MSDDGNNFFAPPAFQPAQALQSLRRALRDLKLNEREGAFEWRGQAVATIEAQADHIAARIAKRPARTPEWEIRSLRSSADTRQFSEEMKKRIARWSERDD